MRDTEQKTPILYITHEDDKYGAAKSLRAIFTYAKSKEFDPIVLTSKNNLYNSYCNENNIKNYVVPYYRATTNSGTSHLIKCIKKKRYEAVNRYALWKVKRIVEKYSVKLIHTNTAVIDLGMKASLLCGIPHIWHIREFLDLDFNQVYYNPLTISNMVKSNSYFIFISEAVKNHWISKGLTGELEVIYNGIDENMFIPAKHSNESNKLRLVMTGHISKSKGQETLIDAISIIDSEVLSHIQLDFFGSGEKDYVMKLKEKVERLGLCNIIRFCGFSNNLNERLSNYDVGVVCSNAEGFGRVTVEYMLSNLCVIASNTGANTEIIEDKSTGLIFECENEKMLSQLITELFKDRKTMTRLAEAGRVRAKKLFNEQRYVESCISMYKKVLHEDKN